ncbi:hypothetical protein GN316_13385 [Xylophilus sp. Kf1]|nr:hypothetical protein [Xylophilus sp. Kf1]
MRGIFYWGGPWHAAPGPIAHSHHPAVYIALRSAFAWGLKTIFRIGASSGPLLRTSISPKPASWQVLRPHYCKPINGFVPHKRWLAHSRGRSVKFLSGERLWRPNGRLPRRQVRFIERIHTSRPIQPKNRPAEYRASAPAILFG